MFGASTTKPAFSFPSTSATQPQQTSSLFNLGSAQPSQPQQTSSLFNSNQPPSLFGNQNKTSSLFSQPAQPAQQQSSLFGGFGASSQPQQQTSGLGSTQQKPFGLSQNQPQQQQPQRPLDQTLRFGQSQQGQPGQPQPDAAQSLWEEGRGMGVYRPIPAQMNIVKDKWDPGSVTSPLRTYLYKHVADEAEALRYRPGPEEDENKWEEAVNNRPGPTWVPLLIRGFYELGKKAQIQMETIQKCNMMLQEINTSLDYQLNTHRQAVATKIAECRRRYVTTSRKTIALAVKVQILRNRGYVMDNAEEQLKEKLQKLEAQVFDPSLEAREQEIWARMLGIRERAKRLKVEMDKIEPATQVEQPLLDEGTVKAAKQTLEAYDTQLRHLQRELELVQQEYEDWEKFTKAQNTEPMRRR